MSEAFTLDPLPTLLTEPLVRSALLEDLGRSGDVTSQSVINPTAESRVFIKARSEGVLAGLDCARTAFRLVDPDLKIAVVKHDGARLSQGDVIAHVQGKTRALLTGERVALNFLGHLSGIATLTSNYVNAVSHTEAQITCTRKTLPGLRLLQKYAVRAGGGRNHRFGLDDGILIKDNHIAAAGSVKAAIMTARKHAGHMLKIEVEVDRLDQLEEVLQLGVDVVLLDNMDVETLREAVKQINGRVIMEASGGVTLDTVGAIAETGVNFISVGALTHSAPNLDVALDFDVQL